MAEDDRVVRMVPRQSWGDRLRRLAADPLFRSTILPVVGLVLLVKLLTPLCFTYVGPNEYGIKVVQVPIAGRRGVHEEVYQTGYHFVLRPFGFEQMFLFPKDV